MDTTKKPAGAYYTSKANREWYKERNKGVFEDKKKGYTNAELIAKYKVSQARITSICSLERKKHEFRNARSKK